jgi:serine/threonine protein kinase
MVGTGSDQLYYTPNSPKGHLPSWRAGGAWATSSVVGSRVLLCQNRVISLVSMSYFPDLLERLVDTHDRYRIEQPLAGRVYLARDLFTGELVALKLLRRATADPENVAFVYEMALYQAIGNDHVVTIKDFGQTKTKAFFYTMEYLEGTTLTAIMATTISPDRAVGITKQICRALAKAHQGIVLPYWNLGNLPVVVPHGKLHPDHVLVMPGDWVKVLNFGFIREAEPLTPTDGTAHSTPVTSMGGELHYIAPEQLEQAAGDTRSDVYVIGLMLYEMLSGTNPYGIQVQNGLPWVMAHAATAPIPLTQRSGCAHFPPELEQITRKCLAKDARQRYQNALDLLTDLEQIPPLTARDEDPTQPHGFDETSQVIAEADGTKTVTLHRQTTADATTVPDRGYPTQGDEATQLTTLEDSFRMATNYHNYSTFLESGRKKKRHIPLLLLGITTGIVVSLLAFAGYVLWQRRSPAPKPQPPEPIDRSI